MEIIKLLIDEGHANVNANYLGSVPLVTAVAHHNIALVKFLLEKGADINRGGMLTPLAKAVFVGDMNIVQFLLLNRSLDVNARDSIALETAVHTENVDVVKLLLEHGAKVTDKIIHKALRTQNIRINSLITRNPVPAITNETILQILQFADTRPENVGGSSSMLRMLEQELWNCFPNITHFVAPYDKRVEGLSKDSWEYRRVLRAHLTVLLRFIETVSLENTTFEIEDIVSCAQLRKTYTSTAIFYGDLFDMFTFNLIISGEDVAYIKVTDYGARGEDEESDSNADIDEYEQMLDIDENIPKAFEVNDVHTVSNARMGMDGVSVSVNFVPSNIDNDFLNSDFGYVYTESNGILEYMRRGMRDILGDNSVDEKQ